MFVLGHLLVSLSGVVHALFQLAWWVLMARIVFSWLNPSPPAGVLRQIVGAIYAVTDPILWKVRRALPFLVVGGLDLTPIALFFALRLADGFVTSTIAELGWRLS